jgi:membrane-associated protease RseP (regulator of RpoE activity)
VQQGQGRVAALIKGSLSGVTAPLSVKQYWERLVRGSGRQRETAYQATTRIELSPQGFQRLVEVYGQDETWHRTRVLPYFPMMGWRHDLAAGAVVAQAEPQSPLAAAGLLPGDVVLAVDDTEVHSLADFRNALERAAARLLDEGGAAQIKVVRGDRGLSLQMTMPRKPARHRRGR